MHLLCTNTTELGKNFYFLGWQKQSKLFLHKAENIKIHLAIIKLLLNYSKMRSIFFPNGNFGPYYLLHWWQTSIKTSAFNEVHNWASFFGKISNRILSSVLQHPPTMEKNCERRKKNQHRIGSNPWSFLVSNPSSNLSYFRK